MKNENKKKLIELENIHVDLKSSFETINVLKGINLKIFKNESVGIIGESGAGKSTLIMCIAGLELISKGKIFLTICLYIILKKMIWLYIDLEYWCNFSIIQPLTFNDSS